MCGIRAPGKGFLLINRREYFQCRSITPVLWSRQGTHRIQNRLLQNFRIVVTTVARNGDMTHGIRHHLLEHRTHIIRCDTFSICRYRKFSDSVIHRPQQHLRIIITTIARSRDMTHCVLHHLLDHRAYIIRSDTFTVRRYRYFRDRIIHRLLQHLRIIITTIARSRDMTHCVLHHLLDHRAYIIRSDTFTVRRYRYFRDRIIHRLLQHLRIIITTIARYRNGPHGVIHHRLQNRAHLIHRHMLL